MPFPNIVRSGSWQDAGWEWSSGPAGDDGDAAETCSPLRGQKAPCWTSVSSHPYFHRKVLVGFGHSSVKLGLFCVSNQTPTAQEANPETLG